MENTLSINCMNTRFAFFVKSRMRQALNQFLWLQVVQVCYINILPPVGPIKDIGYCLFFQIRIRHESRVVVMCSTYYLYTNDYTCKVRLFAKSSVRFTKPITWY